MKRRLTAEDRDALIEALRLPRSFKAIAADFMLHPKTVSGIARANGFCGAGRVG